jgi:mono/diheme cytochrome c family protein
MKSANIVLAFIALTATPALTLAALQDQQPPAAKASKAPTAHASQQYEGDGERIFQQNCSRCHMAPEGFSPRISGTIVRHMRVRASLSKHDEDEVLRFLNP